MNIPLGATLSYSNLRDVFCGILAQFYAHKNHTKIRCKYFAIKQFRCQDIPCIQKISDARTIKNR